MSSLAASPPRSSPAAGWRWIAVAGSVAALGLTALGGASHQLPSAPSGSTPVATPPSAAPAVTAIAAQAPSRQIEVIAQLAPGAPAGALVHQAGGVVTQRLPIIGAVVARLSAAGAVRLAGDPGVRHVSLNASVRRTDDGSTSGDGVSGSDDASPNAYSASAASTNLPSGTGRATGKGITVAVIDTGVAGDQPDFAAADGNSRVIASAVVNPDATTASDTIGHGTHIAGLIAGNSQRRNDGLRGRYLGVAPQSRIVSVKISDDQGNTTVADVIDGLQFVVQHKDDLGIRVANLSLNSTVAEPASDDPLDAAAEVTWANGIVVVAAAGNRGSASDATWYAPANDPYVVTVGAVDDQGTKHLGDDVVTDWSSRGPTQDGTMKPDVVAPGAHLVSVLAPGAQYATDCPSCVVDGNYLQLGGTSMAAGVASGDVADLLQAHPDWTPNQVKGALVDAGRNVNGGLEIKLQRTIGEDGSVLANAGATPSTLLPAQDGSMNLADWTRMSFTRMSFTRMSFTSLSPGDPLNAAWSRMSFTCACRPSTPPADNGSGASADPSRMSFTRMSFTRMSFTTSFTK